MTNKEWLQLDDDGRARALVDAGMSEDDVYKLVDCDIDELDCYINEHDYDVDEIIEDLFNLEYFDYAE